MKLLAVCLFAFLLGSVPTGIIVARRRGIDLKRVGSGNIGATNVLRSAGKGAAVITLSGDILKGVAAALTAACFFPDNAAARGVAGFCSILGHDFSVFSKFRGGKGVATSIGVVAIYSPLAGLIIIIIWIMTAAVTRYSSLAALLSFGALPGVIFLRGEKEKVPVALCITLLLFWKHRDNIRRLAAGMESKIGSKE